MKWYAAVKGDRPGLYNDKQDAEKQIRQHSGCYAKEFPNKDSALEYMREHLAIPATRFYQRYLPNTKSSFK
jgi:viroplasmin and RNaseH domain-containing protein